MTTKVTSAAWKPKTAWFRGWSSTYSCGNSACVSRGLCALFEIVYEIHPRYTLIQICHSSGLSSLQTAVKINTPHPSCPTSWYTLHRRDLTVSIVRTSLGSRISTPQNSYMTAHSALLLLMWIMKTHTPDTVKLVNTCQLLMRAHWVAARVLYLQHLNRRATLSSTVIPNTQVNENNVLLLSDIINPNISHRKKKCSTMLVFFFLQIYPSLCVLCSKYVMSVTWSKPFVSLLGIMFLRNVDIYLQVHTRLNPRRQTSTPSPPEEPKVSYSCLFLCIGSNQRERERKNSRRVDANIKSITLLEGSQASPARPSVVYFVTHDLEGQLMWWPLTMSNFDVGLFWIWRSAYEACSSNLELATRISLCLKTKEN
jgi:hypothetical protein